MTRLVPFLLLRKRGSVSVPSLFECNAPPYAVTVATRKRDPLWRNGLRFSKSFSKILLKHANLPITRPIRTCESNVVRSTREPRKSGVHSIQARRGLRLILRRHLQAVRNDRFHRCTIAETLISEGGFLQDVRDGEAYLTLTPSPSVTVAATIFQGPQQVTNF